MLLRSPHPSVEIPDVPLHEFVLSEVDRRPDQIAFVDGLSDMSVKFGDLRGMVDTTAAWLAAQGIVKGDVVAILSPNTPFYVPVFHGIMRAGAIATPINSLYEPEEIAEQLRDSGAKLLFTVSFFLDKVTAALAEDGVVVGTTVVLDPTEGYPSLLDVLTAEGPPPAVTFDPANDLAILPYTSGTVAPPRGVMLTHRAVVANLSQLRPLGELDHNSKLLAVMPFSHIYGLTLLMNLGIVMGVTLVTVPNFVLEEFLQVIEKHRITFLPVAPPIAVVLAKDPLVDQHDLSSLDTVFSAAAVLDTELADAVAARLNCKVHQGYGVTEMSPATHVVPDARTDIPAGSVGPALPNTEFKLVNPVTGAELDEAEIAAGGQGELWCRGPQAMVGYWNNPAETAVTRDADGFIRTGDLATVDAAGNVTIVDRVADLILVDDHQIAPAELESLLFGHPKVADAAVIGVPGDGGMAAKALIVPGADGLTAEAVIAFIAERVPAYKQVSVVEFVDTLPRTAAGKILRRELRAREATLVGAGAAVAGGVAAGTDLRASVEKVVTDAMAEFGFEPADVTMDATLDDLGVSSLDMVELIQIAREEYKVELQAPELVQCTTLGDVVTLVTDRAAAVSAPQ